MVGAVRVRAGAVHESGGPTATAVAAALQLLHAATAVDLPDESDLEARICMIVSEYADKTIPSNDKST